MSLIPKKAYKNLEFLNSRAARPIRILCEYEETKQRFARYDVKNTIVFFGSARSVDPETAQARMARAQDLVAANPDDPKAQQALRKAKTSVRLAPYYDAARDLAREVTAWSMNRPHGAEHYHVCSGGGPGMMEAANRGASDVPDGRSIGLGISLPFEAGVNKWVSPELAFEFHYFFTRKLWFLYHCEGLVVFPGGFGTMDELFETLTLVQTNKIKRKIPIILFGTEYWKNLFNFDLMVEWGTISPDDLDLFHITDSVEDAMEVLRSGLLHREKEREEAGLLM